MTGEAGRDAQALELRKAGVGYGVIAERLGFESEDAARHAVAVVLDDALADAGREAALLDRLMLDGMLTGLYSKVRAGDSRAIELSLRVLERKRLLSLGGEHGEESSGEA